MSRLELQIDRLVLPAGSAMDPSTTAALKTQVGAAIEAELAARLGVPATVRPRSATPRRPGRRTTVESAVAGEVAGGVARAVASAVAAAVDGLASTPGRRR